MKQLFWHCRNLAIFVAVYKCICEVLRRLGLKNGLESLIAGGVGGWVAFGEGSGVSGAVNQQINLYLFARGLEGLLRSAAKRFNWPDWANVRTQTGFRNLTAGTIALSMYLMDYEPQCLRDGLVQGMHSIYWGSNSGSAAVPWNWMPLVLGMFGLVAVSPKWPLETLLKKF